MRNALRVGLFALAFGTVAGLSGQEPKPKGEPKAEPKGGVKPDMRFKGQLPSYWGQLGLTAAEKEKVYLLQAKYNQDIDKLEKQIKQLKDALNKERFEVLTPVQKKALEDILLKKAGGGK